MIPQILYFFLSALGLGITLKNYDTKVDGEYNCISDIVSLSLVQLLYWWGGFYNQFHWPQLVILIFTWINLVSDVAKHGKHYEGRVGKSEIASTIISSIINATLLYFGGFFNPIL